MYKLSFSKEKKNINFSRFVELSKPDQKCIIVWMNYFTYFKKIVVNISPTNSVLLLNPVI